MVFSAAKLWWQGANPYDFEAGYAAFVEAGGSGRPKDPVWFTALYPPPTYAVLGPISVGSWGLAKGLWLAASTFSALAVCLCVRRLVQGFGVTGFSLGFLAVGWFAFGPVHTTLYMGQFGLIVLALCCPAVLVCCRTDKQSAWQMDLLAAVALGIAGALKPQLAGPVGLAVVLLGRFRLAGLSLLVFGALLAVSIGRLSGEVGAGWLEAWRANLQHFSGAGFADPRPANAHAYQMINAAPIAYRLLPEAVAKFAGLLPFAATVVVGVWWGLGSLRKPTRPLQALLLLGVLCVAGLVSVYHRGYDAVFLILPVCWAAGVLSLGSSTSLERLSARFVLLVALVFLLPVPSMISAALHRGWLPVGLGDNAWFVALILGHQQWVLLGLWVVLMWVLIADRVSAEVSGLPGTEGAA